jgi:hypothetical protein
VDRVVNRVEEGGQQPEEGEWLTLREAASKLGVSIQTLRRRLKEGVYEAKQVSSGFGPTWVIRLGVGQGPYTKVIVAPHQVEQADYGQNGEVGQAEQGQLEQGQPEREGIVEALRLIRDLQQENRDLAGQVGFYQAQLLQSQFQLREAQETILALEAPKTEPKEEGAKSWWRMWWQKLTTGLD